MSLAARRGPARESPGVETSLYGPRRPSLLTTSDRSGCGGGRDRIRGFVDRRAGVAGSLRPLPYLDRRGVVGGDRLQRRGGRGGVRADRARASRTGQGDSDRRVARLFRGVDRVLARLQRGVLDRGALRSGRGSGLAP